MNVLANHDSEAQSAGTPVRPSAPSLVLVGASFRTCDIGSRERISRNYSAAVRSGLMFSDENVTENSVLETCNRLEIYLVCGDAERAAESAVGRLAGGGISRDRFYIKTGLEAIRHLFRVASGLDSVVVGEEQILQQVRDAGRTARVSGEAKSVLSSLFDAAYSSGGRVRDSYRVLEANKSVSAFALQRALVELGHPPSRVLLIGSGETAKLAAIRLKASEIFLLSGRKDINGRFSNAIRIPHSRLREVAAKCDLIIAATRRKGYVLTRGEVPDSRKTVILDLGFPRNVDPSIRKSKFLRLYDLDDIAEWARDAKSDAPSPAERMAEGEARRFEAWLTASRLTPTLANIFRWADRIREEETSAALRKLPRLSAHERLVVEALAKRLTGKLLSPHTSFLKGVGRSDDQRQRILLLESIFRDGCN